MAAGALLAAVAIVSTGREPERRAASAVAPSTEPSKAPPAESVAEDPAQCAPRPVRLPRGEPAMLSCGAARAVIAEVRARSALPIPSPKAAEFAEAVSGWLDPHGMWSAAPDSPVRVLLQRHAASLLREIELPPSDASPCAVAVEIGRATRAWVSELRRDLTAGERAARAMAPREAFALASDGVFQDDPVTRPGRELARDLGLRIAAFRAAFPRGLRASDEAPARFLPELGEDSWAKVALAASVRAYVPASDPHGQWVPFEEEWSLYSTDPALATEPRLWGRMLRTAVGVRVLEEPTPPLAEDDLVLEVGGVATAGLSVEQIEQLSHVEALGAETNREVVVLRRGEAAPRKLSVDTEQQALSGADELGKTRVSFGGGSAWVISIADVPDELGEDLEQLVASIEDEAEEPVGLLLDLRGNGGGSLDGAVGAIGVFLPGAPSFPLRRRDGEVEVQHAPVPPRASQWRGPVAALVDGYTASAAEMIAGALGSYQRGPVLGARTFGKGCVQEYFDDRAGAGVLRLTTMLFSLPDGSPLQGVGLTPTLGLELPTAHERERSIPGSLEPWRGPDVRSSKAMGGPDWPSHEGRVGPCADAAVCAALRRLGQPRRSAAVVPGRASRRASPP